MALLILNVIVLVGILREWNKLECQQKQLIREVERVTERITSDFDAGKTWKSIEEQKPYPNVYRKLQEYETAEEEGRLVVLPAPLNEVDTFGRIDGSYWVRIPCGIGDNFYRIVTDIHTKRKSIKNAIVSRIAITNSEIQIFADDVCGKGIFGRTAFVTREEAEKALEEMTK